MLRSLSAKARIGWGEAHIDTVRGRGRLIHPIEEMVNRVFATTLPSNTLCTVIGTLTPFDAFGAAGSVSQ